MATCTRRTTPQSRDAATSGRAGGNRLTFGWELPDGPVAAAAARRVVHAVLRWWGLPQLADDAALMADELVANAVEHGRPPVLLRLTVTGRRLICEVADAGPSRPQCRVPGDDEERGRGLMVVDALAESWESRPARGHGKIVRFCQRLPAGWAR